MRQPEYCPVEALPEKLFHWFDAGALAVKVEDNRGDPNADDLKITVIWGSEPGQVPEPEAVEQDEEKKARREKQLQERGYEAQKEFKDEDDKAKRERAGQVTNQQRLDADEQQRAKAAREKGLDPKEPVHNERENQKRGEPPRDGSQQHKR